MPHLLNSWVILGSVEEIANNFVTCLQQPSRIIPPRRVRQEKHAYDGDYCKGALQSNRNTLESRVSQSRVAILAAPCSTHPRSLIGHTSEAEVDPVSNGGARNEPDAGEGNLWAALLDFSRHLGLVHWDGT